MLQEHAEQSGDSWAAYSAPTYTAPTGRSTPSAAPCVPALPQATESLEFTRIHSSHRNAFDEMVDFWQMRDHRFGSLEQRGKWVHFGTDHEFMMKTMTSAGS